MQTVQKTACGTGLRLTNSKQPFVALCTDLAVIGCQPFARRISADDGEFRRTSMEARQRF